MSSHSDNQMANKIRQSRLPRRHRSLGFSLVEIMVVIVIIGLLAGVVTFSVRSYLTLSKQNVAKLEISKISQALETFYTSQDRYPTNEEGLIVSTQPSNDFPNGLLSFLPDDPWGYQYEYVSPARTAAFEVVSYGADHREGGAGADKDLRSDELMKKQKMQ